MITKQHKPHHGRIKDWSIVTTPQGDRVVGHFLDHPTHRGPNCRTSRIVKITIETENSQYTLVREGEESRRSGWPHKGDRCRFLGENGYDHDLAAAMKVFVTGAPYTVEAIEIGGWSHTIKFEGIPGWYNGVMFELIK